MPSVATIWTKYSHTRILTIEYFLFKMSPHSVHITLSFLTCSSLLIFSFVQKRLKSGGSVTCLFTETISELDNYTEFRPVQKTDWYIGFTHNGAAKNIKRCRPGSRSVQFLKLPLQEDRQVVKQPDEGIKQIYDMLRELMRESQRPNS